MTKIKLCGMKRLCDIEYANKIMPDFIGFVFAQKSQRYVTFDEAKKLRSLLHPDIISVGVFVNETIENIKTLSDQKVINIAQLHGNEDEEYIKRLRKSVKIPIIKAFHIETKEDIANAEKSTADYIMLDSGGGTGRTFDHSLIKDIKREFFLAGGLDSKNICEAIEKCAPFAVDASSSLETNGVKDFNKMREFVCAVKGRKSK